ncbi:arsenate reductase (glutaredoxin) [Flavobacteriaceae bacterium]|jgi:arsenate reductase (glutaredoxin)|nr:arsenate reductase (glutaredoxin) [Flavobacteriaceae bacterium]CAI8345266.1 MAG: Arsenate reductase [Formosa sp. Hel3_A1_48]
MITIYHNPRCSKSRLGVKALEESGKEFEIINYLDGSLTFDELKTLIDKLGIIPLELVRQNEAIWKTNFKGKTLSDAELVHAMIDHPKLIERPIVVHGNKAVIGRPTERILDLI